MRTRGIAPPLHRGTKGNLIAGQFDYRTDGLAPGIGLLCWLRQQPNRHGVELIISKA